MIITPMAKWLAFKFKVLDYPSQRKIHGRPIPLLGGEVIYLALAITFLIMAPEKDLLWKEMLVGLLFVGFGFIDDGLLKMKARNKIWMHLLFSLIFILITGITFKFVNTEWINIILT